MQSHVRVLAILHIIFGGLGVLTAIFLMAFSVESPEIIGLNASGDDARIAIPVIGGIGALVVMFTAMLSLPSIIAGIGPAFLPALGAHPDACAFRVSSDSFPVRDRVGILWILGAAVARGLHSAPLLQLSADIEKARSDFAPGRV